MRVFALVFVAMLAAFVACLKSVSYECSNDSFCLHSGVQGTCESTNYCAFPDSSCPSGDRYGGEGPFANQCVGSAMMIDGGGSDASDAPAFTIGGSATGLANSGSNNAVVIADNGSDMLTVGSNGAFTFTKKVESGSDYDVTIVTQPATRTCVGINAIGTVAGANITDVHVACAGGGGNNIACGGSMCQPVGTNVCCHGKMDTTGTCATQAAGCAMTVAEQRCDDSADCGGSTTGVCCAHLSSAGAITGVIACVSDSTRCTASGGGSAEVLCDPGSPQCPNGLSCNGNDATHNWHYCK